MVDLHMHTKASDGTDNSRSLLENLRSKGIRIFSVTDHDTFEGIYDMEYEVPADMVFIRGIEVSCVTEIRNCHILGYGFNKDVRAFAAMVNKAMAKRQEVVETHLNFIKDKYGIEISEDLKQYANKDWKARLAKILVAMGKATDEKQARETYIKPCNTNGIRIDAREAIAGILAAGGIPVWAHPYGGYTKRDMNDEEFEKQLKILLDAGLQGIECYYSGFDEAQVKSLLKVAKEHNLFISGGSDYHGECKDIKLGTLDSYGKEVSEEELTILAELSKRQKEKPFPLIEIEEWHNPGACFWFEPVMVKDLSQNTYSLDNLRSMEEAEISISSSSFEDFLYPLFERHFDKDLPENKGRYEEWPEGRKYMTEFEWYLTDNFYTYDKMVLVLHDIELVANRLENSYEDTRLDFLREGLRHLPDYMPEYWHLDTKLSDSEADKITSANRSHIVDFYRRFVKSIREMMQAGEKAGYNRISVCGP